MPSVALCAVTVQQSGVHSLGAPSGRGRLGHLQGQHVAVLQGLESADLKLAEVAKSCRTILENILQVFLASHFSDCIARFEL